MKQKEIFELFIRCLGLLLILYALHPVYLFFIWLLPGVAPSFVPQILYMSIYCFAIGVYFLRGAKKLVSFVYPDKEQENKEP
jgi:hypothetical protein